jgi:putative transposase
MARMPRLVVPGLPHHVTQRGGRRQLTFFVPGDFRYYLCLMADSRARAGVDVWAYCLMPNHVHLIVVPEREDSLAAWFGEGHRRYSSVINQREEWRGHLWQERFYSSALDERHLWEAARYVELNPVRAGLCRDAAEWPWSSARAHLTAEDDALVRVSPLLDRVGCWTTYLGRGIDTEVLRQLRQSARTGRPLGDEAFVRRIEYLTGRSLAVKPPGRPRAISKPGDSLPITAAAQSPQAGWVKGSNR